MEKEKALEEFNAMQSEGTQEAQPASEPSQAPQGQTPAETAYLEAIYEGKTSRLPLSAEFMINENGQVQRIPANKLINGYRQVSHLQREQKKFKEERSKWEQDNQGYDALKKHYGEIDNWARQNPDQWTKLQELYSKRDSLLVEGENPQGQLIEKFNTTIKGLEDRLSKYENMYKQSEDQKAVSEVQTEMDSFKKEFSGINLDEQDEDGISLKSQILKYGADNGYPTFRAAALDYKFPDGTPLLTKLLETAREQSRNAAVKGAKQDFKNGVVARSSTPATGQNSFATNNTKVDRKQQMTDELESLLGGHNS